MINNYLSPSNFVNQNDMEQNPHANLGSEKQLLFKQLQLLCEDEFIDEEAKKTKVLEFYSRIHEMANDPQFRDNFLFQPVDNFNVLEAGFFHPTCCFTPFQIVDRLTEGKFSQYLSPEDLNSLYQSQYVNQHGRETSYLDYILDDEALFNQHFFRPEFIASDCYPKITEYLLLSHLSFEKYMAGMRIGEEDSLERKIQIISSHSCSYTPRKFRLFYLLHLQERLYFSQSPNYAVDNLRLISDIQRLKKTNPYLSDLDFTSLSPLNKYYLGLYLLLDKLKGNQDWQEAIGKLFSHILHFNPSHQNQLLHYLSFKVSLVSREFYTQADQFSFTFTSHKDSHCKIKTEMTLNQYYFWNYMEESFYTPRASSYSRTQNNFHQLFLSPVKISFELDGDVPTQSTIPFLGLILSDESRFNQNIGNYNGVAFGDLDAPGSQTNKYVNEIYAALTNNKDLDELILDDKKLAQRLMYFFYKFRMTRKQLIKAESKVGYYLTRIVGNRLINARLDNFFKGFEYYCQTVKEVKPSHQSPVFTFMTSLKRAFSNKNEETEITLDGPLFNPNLLDPDFQNREVPTSLSQEADAIFTDRDLYIDLELTPPNPTQNLDFINLTDDLFLADDLFDFFSSNLDNESLIPQPPTPLISTAPLQISPEKLISLQADLFNTFISVFKSNSTALQEVLQAVYKNGGNFCFYFDQLSNNTQQAFLKPLGAFLRNQQFSEQKLQLVKECLDHFGIKFSSPQNTPPLLRPLAADLVLEIDQGNLEKKFCSVLIPALLEHKIQQWPRITRFFNQDLTPQAHIQPCFLIKTHQSKVVLIPSQIEFRRFDVNNQWSDEITKLSQDEGQCLALINTQFNTTIQQTREDGIIELSLDEWTKFMHSFQNNSSSCYPLIDAGQVVPLENPNPDTLDPSDVDSTKESSAMEIEKRSEILKKRPRAVFEETSQEFNEDLLNIKKTKLAYGDEEVSSSHTNKITSRKENSETSFELSNITQKKQKATSQDDDDDVVVEELLSIREGAAADSKKEQPTLDVGWSDYFTDYFSTIKDSVEKNTLVNHPQAIQYPILKKMRTLPLTREPVFPFIGSLTHYQREAFQRVNHLLNQGIVPLLSLSMGLGKTSIYMSLIAKKIAENDRGLCVILTNAGTRDKTVQETYAWLSEAKLTALLSEAHREPANFNALWKNKMCMAKWSIKTETNLLTFWESWQPLILSSLKLSDSFSVSSMQQEIFLENVEAAINYYIDFYAKKHPDLLDKFKAISHLTFQEEKEWSIDSPDHALTVLKEVAKVECVKRVPLEAGCYLPPDQSKRLLQFYLNKIGKYSKNTPILNYTDAAILVMSYEDLKGLCLEGETVKTNNPLFNKPTLLVVADEASLYHTSDNSINKALNAYQKALSPSKAVILPVTATPFENNLKELISLLNISNKTPQGKNAVVERSQLEALKALEKSATEALADYLTHPQKNSWDKCQQLILNSFKQAYILQNILRNLVIELDFNNEVVNRDWNGKIPTIKMRKITLDFDNPELIDKIKKIETEFFSSTKGKKSGLNFLSISASIARLLVDSTLEVKSYNSVLNIEDKLIKNSLKKIEAAIKDYKNGNKNALDNYFLAKNLITSEKIKQKFQSATKNCYIHKYEVEAKIVELVLTHYYGRRAIVYGKTDKERSENLHQLEMADPNTTLILPLKAGGLGLNLGYLDNMIIGHDDWNPAIINQVIGRIRRVGRAGDRDVLMIFHQSIYHDFLGYTKNMKELMGKFYISPGSLEDKLKGWLSILNHRALKNFLLNSTQPGLYTINNQLIPILNKYATAQELSLEGRLAILMGKICPILEELSREIEQLTYYPAPKKTLSAQDWVVIPLPAGKSFEEYAKLASFIANPKNVEVVSQSLSRIGYYLFLLRKDPHKIKALFTDAREKGDAGILNLMKLANEDATTTAAAAVYGAAGPTEFKIKNRETLNPQAFPGTIYEEKKGEASILNILVKKQDITAWSKTYKSRR